MKFTCQLKTLKQHTEKKKKNFMTSREIKKTETCVTFYKFVIISNFWIQTKIHEILGASYFSIKFSKQKKLLIPADNVIKKSRTKLTYNTHSEIFHT